MSLLAGAWRGWDRIGVNDWNYFLSQTQAEVTSIARYGQWPLWTPWRVGGQPTLGQPETMLYSPVTPLALLVGTLAAYKLLLLPVFLAGCLGMHALAGALGLRGRARLVPALLFFGSTIYPLYVVGGWPNWLCAMAILPWLLLACRRATDDLRWVPAAALLYAGLLYCGALFHFVMLPVFLALEALGRCLARRGPAPLLALAVIGLLGVLLAAPRVVPLLEMYGAFPRLRSQVQDDLPPSVLPEIWLQSELPDLSTPRSPLVVRPDGGAYWIYVGSYLGPVGLALAALGLLSLRRAIAWLVAGGATLWLAFGTAVTPSPWERLHDLPVYASMHSPQRLVPLVTLCLAVLAGLGFQRLELGLARLPARAARALGWTALALLVVPLLVVGAPVTRHAFTIAPAPGLEHGPFRQRALPARPQQWGGENYEAVLANVGSVHGFSDIPSPRAAVPEDDPRYRGEVHLLDGHGTVDATITPNRIEVDALLDAPDRLVVNQTWFPGWRAEGGVSATPVPHEDLLSLPLPAGRHRFTLAYRPRSVPLGLLYGLGAAVVAGLWLLARRRAPVRRPGAAEWAALAGCLVLAAGIERERPPLQGAPPSRTEPHPVIANARVADAGRDGPGALQVALDAAAPGDVVLVRPGRYDAPRLQRGAALYAQPGGRVRLAGTLRVEGLPAGQFVALVGRDDAPLELECAVVLRDCAGTVVLQSARLATPAGGGEPALTAEVCDGVLLLDVTVSPAASLAPAAIAARDARLVLRRTVVRAPGRPVDAGAGEAAVGVRLVDASLVGTAPRVDGAPSRRGAGGPALALVRSDLLLCDAVLEGGRGVGGRAPALVLREGSRAELSTAAATAGAADSVAATGPPDLDASSALLRPEGPRPAVAVAESTYLGRSVLLDLAGPPGARGIVLLATRPAGATPFDVPALLGVDRSSPHVVLPVTLADDGRLSLRTRVPARLVQGGGGLFAQLVCERVPGGAEPWASLPDGRLFELTDER